MPFYPPHSVFHNTTAEKRLSLRSVAKELGVSHSLLVRWRQGKRKLRPELEAKYWEVVTSGDKRGRLDRSPDTAGNAVRRALEMKWATLESNQGPQSYQDCALTD